MVEAVKPQYQIAWVNCLTDIPKAAWDALAVPLRTPFLEWDWLTNLETSGSATAKTGWLPNHLAIWRGQTLIAAAPLYLKGHSYGEFVFDQEWADLAASHGDKLLSEALRNDSVHARRGLPIFDRARGR